MRGIAGKREATGHHRPGEVHVERPGGAGTRQRKRAQPIVEARLDLGKKTNVVERQDLARPARLLRPGDARAVARQRQDGEGAPGQEMLHGAALMRLLVSDGGDDADLRVAPAHDFDARRLAQPRSAPVRGNQQRGSQGGAAGQIYGDIMLIGRKAFGSSAAQ